MRWQLLPTSKAVTDKPHVGAGDELRHLLHCSGEPRESEGEILSAAHQHECDHFMLARIDGLGIAGIGRPPQYALIALSDDIDVLLISLGRELLGLIQNTIEFRSLDEVGKIGLKPQFFRSVSRAAYDDRSLMKASI
jgi:hypothetical protein